MHFQGKALAAHLLSQGERDIDHESYRRMNSEELFQKLEEFDLFIDEKQFLEYADVSESPEELTQNLTSSEELNAELYLLVFEAWRRFCPHRQTISLFADELDHTITLYDQEQLEDEENLQTLLESLESLLDDSVDQGENPKEAFVAINSYCTHDLETFLYEYILYQIEVGHLTYASELVDGFTDYVKDERWFEFLRIRLASDVETMLSRFLESLQEKPDFAFR